MADDLDTAIRLLEEALHLRTNGEYAPGGTENWPDWFRKTETFLRARLEEPRVEIIYLESWRPEGSGPDVPSRPGWQVRCSEHGMLRSPQWVGDWAYEAEAVARMVATRHRRRHARGEIPQAGESSDD